MMSFSMWLSNSQKSLYKWIANTFGTTQPLLFTGATIGVGIISGAAYLYTNPESLFYWTDRYMLSSAGFSVKYIQGNNCTFCYAEHGQLRSDKPSLLFIDRFSGRKESWMKVCKGLPSALHIICVELPGQGDTTLHEDQNMASLYRLTDLLAEFASLLNLEVVPHHVVGWSMGGSVAALYAAKYPQFVRRLTLIAPLMQCPIETEFWSVKEDTEHLPFLTNDPEQLKVLAEKSFHNPDLAPKSLWVYKALIKRIQTKREFLKELYVNMKEEITEESSKFDNLLSKIKCPVQVIWGEQDQGSSRREPGSSRYLVTCVAAQRRLWRQQCCQEGSVLGRVDRNHEKQQHAGRPCTMC
ncbi:hypothetical protein LSH36_213g03019 [Paralvinella palmiformis]|uniref:acylglycerol lipase n=1 Tax=Paralvinella palmiformis TaxID=53620 RepID=A0AAD9JPB6_9ANNE|nr:hypothetical protein LSH36_213g03019 [Paralvinella palmiformis]